MDKPAEGGAEQKELLGLPAPGTYRGAPDAGEEGKRTLDMSSGEAKVEVRARKDTRRLAMAARDVAASALAPLLLNAARA